MPGNLHPDVLVWEHYPAARAPSAISARFTSAGTRGLFFLSRTFFFSPVLATLNMDRNAFAHEWSIKSLEYKPVSASACVGPHCSDPSHVCRHYPCLNFLLLALSEDATAVTTQEQVLAAATLHLSGQQHAWKDDCLVLVKYARQSRPAKQTSFDILNHAWTVRAKKNNVKALLKKKGFTNK